MNFISQNLNINLFENPATVEIDGKGRGSAFGGLYFNSVKSFACTASDQIEQVKLENFMPSFDIGIIINGLQIYLSGEYEVLSTGSATFDLAL